jgi:hypothetical protein
MNPKIRGFEEGLRRFPLLPVGLLLTASGLILLAWTVWLVWYDVTVWGKDVASILFDPRSGEVMSLGIGVRAFHYLFLGLAFLFIGPVALIVHSVNSLSMTMERLETSHTEPSKSFPTQLTTKIAINILNGGFIPVHFRVGEVQLNINNIDVSAKRRQFALFVENEYTIPRYSGCQFVVSCSLSGEEADALHSTKEWDILMVVNGEASCLIYRVPVSARGILNDNLAS